ncbi:unnamed protein product [Spirodela intermedia]|uniref:Uncharacterized protein n=2 Tax=Spirodela intermedia TaxID=51605 RepID=A0A7I8K472_SPIIN|nr:unnamed protein product [Spirodela intermedia]CAA6656434.1 unnamed protein product [Spirodela intermedia]CAA7392009.1 unnamed protein product [Spirodela intermedia]
MGNLKNACIAFLVPFPSLIFFVTFLHRYDSAIATSAPAGDLWEWCAGHPLLLANLLFFANVDVLFWIIGLLQSNNWMIDLYWTVIPVMLVHYYAAHPRAVADPARSTIVTALTWAWSLRLTYSYFRREQWQWGAREDWRYHSMRKDYGRNWWWLSFFAVYLSQQVFLIGICLPMYAVHSSNRPWGAWDSLAAAVCIAGITIAYFADTQLHRFVTRNRALEELGAPTVPTLDTGLWRCSRHPNYFGEQLWWWGLCLFALNVGQGWTSIGAAINSLSLVYITVLVERQMLRKKSRTEAYREYQRTTSVWIPWFKKTVKETKTKTR